MAAPSRASVASGAVGEFSISNVTDLGMRTAKLTLLVRALGIEKNNIFTDRAALAIEKIVEVMVSSVISSIVFANFPYILAEVFCVMGSGSIREQCPLEGEVIPSVRTSMHPSIPP